MTYLAVRPTPVALTGYYEATRHPRGWHFTANEIPGSRGGALITIAQRRAVYFAPKRETP